MGSVRVVSLSAFVVEIPLRRTIRHASHVRTSTDNIIVRCVLSDGTVGWGEGVPREYVTGESADSAITLLKAGDYSRLEKCIDFPSAVQMIESFALPNVPGDDRQCQGNAARCALELALLDAFGRSFGESLTTVTKLVAPELLEVKPKVQYSGVITSTRGLKLVALALWYRFSGFRQIKIKVGIDNDRKRVRKLRRILARSMQLRIDANEAWSPAEAVERLSELEQFQLESAEQPVPHEDIGAFASMTRPKIPVMLDESLCSLTDAERAVSEHWGSRFNLRISKCGGYISTLRLAAFAQRNGIGCQLGCQVGESAILTCAGRHFATSVRGLVAIEGSFDRHLVHETLAFYDHTFGRGGWAPALDGSGHGALVDADAIERLKTRHEVFVE